jgi:DNA-binding winged helix-turn-helix (wHTH) protein
MIYRFGDCLLYAERYELHRAAEVIAVEPKVYEVLLYLLAHRDRVVSRAELVEQCWPETYVSHETLNRCVTRVRQAIGQTRRGPRLIQTVYGTGYRFIGPVTELAQAPGAETAPGTPVPPPVSAVGQSPSRLPVPATPESSPPERLVPPTPLRFAAATPPSLAAERRQLTILHCALVDATRLMAELDPKDFHGTIRAFRALCLEIITRYEGHVAQYFDVGFVVYFGYPQAHEDDAQRAMHSALEMVENLRCPSPASLPGAASGLAVQVGIHTGVVIAEPWGGLPSWEGTCCTSLNNCRIPPVVTAGVPAWALWGRW